MAIFDKFKDKRWREQVCQELAAKTAFQQYLFGKSWLCPYCGKVAIDDAKGRPDLPDLVLAHLKACPDWKEFGGKTRSAGELAESVLKTEVAQHMKTNPLWRVRDPAGNWHCPFCARPTEITFESNKLTRELLAAICRHLPRCYAYDSGKGQPQTLQYLQSLIESGERIKRLTAVAGAALLRDPLWQFKNERHRWACPYCKRIVESVDMSSELLTSSVAPREIARHFVEGCPQFREDQPPAASLAEMESLTSSPEKKAGAVTHGVGAEKESAVFAAIRAELDQMHHLMSEAGQGDAKQKEMMRSLEKAGEHQREMLPDLPQVPGFEFEVLYRPMATVSGDFYDFFKVSEGEIGIAIGDVSGHGMEAALIMSMVKKSLKIHGRGVTSPAETLRVTNADIHEDLAQNTFLSIAYGVLDTARKVLKFSRAGHCPLMIFNPARRPPLASLEPRGIVVGIDKGPVFNRTLEEVEIQLAPGDMLVQFTDGVVEANNKKKEEFGMERLGSTVRQFGNHEAKYLAHMIEMTLNDFRAGGVAEDDVTVVCVKVL